MTLFINQPDNNIFKTHHVYKEYTNLYITLPRFRVKITWLLKNKVAHKPANVTLTKALTKYKTID